MKIEIKKINKAFKDLQLFKDLNLVIESNTITCFYGFSGCGKTTLLNMIGLIEKYDGEILYDGKNITKTNDINSMLKNKIGFIFQDSGLIENETVLNNLRLVKKIRNKKEDEIENVLEELNLKNILNKKIYKLSGGEKQRVAIAKVLLKDVELVLADEPTGSIDEENAQIVLSIIKKMKKDGKTIIICSHDDRVKKISDNIIDISQLRV